MPALGLLAAICVGDTLLRLFHLTRKSMWLDEAYSVKLARTDWPPFFHVLYTREADMAVYHVVLHEWVQLGSSAFVVRSLSLIFSVATLPVVYALGARLFGKHVGLVGAALLAVNAFDVRFAQEARGYSLLLLLASVSTLFFVRAIEEGARRDWIGYVVASVLAVYTHFFGGLVLGAQWASLTFLRRRDVPWRSLALSVATIGALLLPLAVFFLTAPLDNVNWIRQPFPAKVVAFVLTLFGIGISGDEPWAAPYALCFIAAYGTCLAAALVAAREVWRRCGASYDAWHYALLIAWLLGPIVFVLSVSRIKPLFVDQYFVECLPPVVLLLAVGLRRLRPPWVPRVMAAVIIGFAVTGVVVNTTLDNKEEWRGATHYVLTHARLGDAALFYPSYVQVPFDYYRERLQGASTAPVILSADADAKLNGILGSLPDRYDRVWVVFSHDDDAGRFIQDSLRSRYPSLHERHFTGIRVLLYDRAAL
jgi:mannosyltransferase